MDRDFVWECDYGDRSKLMPVLCKLLDEQDETSLQMVQVLVNNVVYNLELYVILSYHNPKDNDIGQMISGMKSLGVNYRPDLTMKYLCEKMSQKRFNAISFSSSSVLTLMFPQMFMFPEKKIFKEEGYDCFDPIEGLSPIFISHQSKNKPEIRELISYLNAEELPVWFDEVSIDYGQSILKELQKGVKNSSAVIFWITGEFLESRWCDTELQTFMQKYIQNEYGKILILPIVDSKVDISKIDSVFLPTLKYLKLPSDYTIEWVAEQIIPTLKRFFNRN